MQQEEAQPPLSYLAYVGFLEGLSAIKSALVAWLILTAIGYVLGFLWNARESFIAVDWFDKEWELPRWAWATLLVGVFSWTLRGQTWRFPLLSFKAWGFGVVVFGAYAAVLQYAPWWASWPLISALLCAFSVLDDLNALGRENCEQLTQTGS